jgi:hypothetical protein
MPRTKKIARLASRFKTARSLLFVDVLLWFCLGIYIVGKMISDGNSWSTVQIGFFMFANAAALLAGWVMLGRRMRWSYSFTLVVLFINLLLTFTNQFGWLDPAILLLDLGIAGMLITIGRDYLEADEKRH